MKDKFARFAFESNRVKSPKGRVKSFSPNKRGEVSVADVDCLPKHRIEEIGQCFARMARRSTLHGWERLSKENVKSVGLHVQEDGMVCDVPHFNIVGWPLCDEADLRFRQGQLVRLASLVRLANPLPAK